jgi:hypothetical protein
MQHEPRRYPNTGKPPRDKTIALGIVWQNGMTSKHTYTADQLRWTITGSEFDVGFFWRADGKGE